MAAAFQIALKGCPGLMNPAEFPQDLLSWVADCTEIDSGKRGGAETLRQHTFLRHAATSQEFQARLEAARAGARPRGHGGQGGGSNGQSERSWDGQSDCPTLGGAGVFIDNQIRDVQAEREGLQCHVQLGASRADSRAGSGLDTVPPSPSELINGGTSP
jgi:hypothetical protein